MQWCYNMKCVMIGERLGAIDGGWSSWSSWSRCSRSCGSGVAFATRKCDHPSPTNSGSYCPGIRKRYKICATNVSLILDWIVSIRNFLVIFLFPFFFFFLLFTHSSLLPISHAKSMRHHSETSNATNSTIGSFQRMGKFIDG